MFEAALSPLSQQEVQWDLKYQSPAEYQSAACYISPPPSLQKQHENGKVLCDAKENKLNDKNELGSPHSHIFFMKFWLTAPITAVKQLLCKSQDTRVIANDRYQWVHLQNNFVYIVWD